MKKVYLIIIFISISIINAQIALPTFQGVYKNLTTTITNLDLTPSSGSVIQTVQHNFTTGNFTTSSSSYVDITGFNQAITPLAASSKILVILSAAIYASPTTTWNGQVGVSVNRSVAGGSYTAVASQMPGSYIQETYTRYFHISCNINFLDSPSYSLGNAITYKLQMKSGDTNISSGCMVSMGGVTNGASKLLLLEVAG